MLTTDPQQRPFIDDVIQRIENLLDSKSGIKIEVPKLKESKPSTTNVIHTENEANVQNNEKSATEEDISITIHAEEQPTTSVNNNEANQNDNHEDKPSDLSNQTEEV
jgi:hypothetical protein